MGVRIGILIALTTLVSYLHMFQTLKGESLQQLERHVAERSQREQAIFVLAEDNHTVLKKALEERIQAWSQLDPTPRFDSLFAPLPDGTIRSRTEGYDGTKSVGVFIPPGLKLDTGLRRRILAAYDVVTQYGPAFAARFINTYITLAEGPVFCFWPERPNWAWRFQRTTRRSSTTTTPSAFPRGIPSGARPGAASSWTLPPRAGWSRSPPRWMRTGAMSRPSPMTSCWMS
jgi:hypothetical protein